MAHFAEGAVLLVALAVVKAVVKVDRLGSVVLLAEEQIYLLVLVVLLQRVKVDCLAQVVLPAEGPVSLLPLIIPTVLLQVAVLQIILVLVLLVHMVRTGPGPVGPREPNNIDDNTITNNKIYAPRNLEGPVIVNPQPAPTTTETPSQTDITVAPTTTEEEQQQETTEDDDGGESTSAEAQNQIPIANAGPSLTVQPSSNVVLDGTKSSDSNGDPLQFLWLQLAGGPTVPLLKNTTASPSFTAPSVSNTTVLTFQLIVSDGQTDSMPAYTYVTVQP